MKLITHLIRDISMAFAFFLTVVIILCIYNFASLLTSNDSKYILDNMKVLENKNISFNELDIDVKRVNIIINKANNFKIETNNKNISYSYKNGKVYIKDKSKKNGYVYYNKVKSNLIISIPSKEYNLISVSDGIGKINISNITSKKLDISLGIGSIKAKNIVALKKANIDLGMGLIDIKDSKLNRSEIDNGVGSIKYSGILTDKAYIDNGIGSITVKLLDDKSNYKFYLDKGIGSITFYDKEKKIKEYGNGSNKVNIDVGIGSISVK